jgi:hypothetical protein
VPEAVETAIEVEAEVPEVIENLTQRQVQLIHNLLTQLLL